MTISRGPLQKGASLSQKRGEPQPFPDLWLSAKGQLLMAQQPSDTPTPSGAACPPPTPCPASQQACVAPFSNQRASVEQKVIHR